MAKLSGVLPGKKENGLRAIEDELCDDLTEGTRRVSIVVTDVKSVTTDADSKTREPTLRVRAFYPVAQKDIPAAKKLMQNAMTELADGSQDGLFEVDSVSAFIDNLLYSTETPTSGEDDDGE